MNASKKITSLQNPLVKQVLTLKEKSRERKKNSLFVIEGQREIQLALKSNYEFEIVFVCPEIAVNQIAKPFGNEIIELSKNVY